MDKSGHVLSTTFTLTEAATRRYPWDGVPGDIPNKKPTDHGTNAAKTIYANSVAIVFIVTLSSLIVVV